MKKSCVSLLTEAGASMTLIAAITRTFVADVLTNARKRDAIGAALGPVIGSIQQPSMSKPPASRAVIRCPYCGEMIQSADWLYCSVDYFLALQHRERNKRKRARLFFQGLLEYARCFASGNTWVARVREVLCQW